MAYAHEFERSRNTQLTVILDYLEKHDTGLGYGMVNS
jgi:hypothetical protein